MNGPFFALRRKLYTEDLVPVSIVVRSWDTVVLSCSNIVVDHYWVFTPCEFYTAS